MLKFPSLLQPQAFRFCSRRLARVAAWLALSLLLLAGIAAGLLLESTPILDPTHKLSHQEIANARKVLDFGMRSARHLDVTNVVALSGEELDATVNYLLRQFVSGIASFQLRSDGLRFEATIPIAYLSWATYINVSIDAVSENGKLAIQSMRLGDANLPGAWVGSLPALIQRFSAVAKFIAVADHAVKEIIVEPERIKLVYGWDSASLQSMRDLFLDITGKKRLRHYHARLVETLSQPGLGKRVPLGELLQPLFELAQERSEDRDPIEENRALLLVLSAYLSGHKTAPVLAANYSSSTAKQRTILLNNRLDLAKHFIISAALAASANSTFADLAGLAKEIDDSHGGSGFNFQDLAADMAGQRFGQLAVASEKSARRLQKRLSHNAEDDAIMPVVRDLPENLDAEEFASRYMFVGSPAFDNVQQDIQQRLDAMTLYWRGSGG